MKRQSIPTIDIKKYGGKQVAVSGGKIIATGRTLDEVVRKARKQAPTKPLHEVRIFAVPKSLSVIYHV
jgi:hypothetical protein